MRLILFSLIALSIVLCISPNAKADLIDQGDGTIRDTDRQIMWLKDAGSAPSMTFDEARAWADGLAVAGYTDWRLPRGTDPSSDQTATTPGDQFYYNAVESEFGDLFYNKLGGCASQHIGTKCVSLIPLTTAPNDDPDLGLFDNIPPQIPVNGTVYWTDMLSDSNPGFAWSFSLGSGAYREADVSLSLRFRGWAVRDIRCTNFFFFTACEGRISLDAIRSALVAALVAGGGIVIFWLWRRRRST